MSLSQYELDRLANIQRNEAMLASLGLSGPKLASPAQPPAKKKKIQRPPPAAQEPVRKSGRIASLPAPAVYVDDERAGGHITLGGADAKHISMGSVERAAKVPSAPMPTAEDEAPETEAELFASEREVYAKLREEKNHIARDLNTAAYHVAQNRALMSMLRRLPTTPAELLECWGWGETKVAAHGERLLGVLGPHVAALRAEQQKRVDEVLEADDDDDDDDSLAMRRDELAARRERLRQRQHKQMAMQDRCSAHTGPTTCAP